MSRLTQAEYVQQIKQDILNKFRKDKGGVSHALPIVWVEQIYLPQLSKRKRQFFPVAVAELQAEGLLWRNTPRLKLTKKGVDYLYPNTGVSPKRKVKEDILQRFRDMVAKTNQELPFEWLGFTYYPTLNPKQRAMYRTAIQELINEGVVERYRDTIKLTALGERKIYG
jgi:predicted transcriptional regulator